MKIESKSNQIIISNIYNSIIIKDDNNNEILLEIRDKNLQIKFPNSDWNDINKLNYVSISETNNK